MTHLQYRAFADASIKTYDGAVARPRRLDEHQRRLWKAYRDLYQELSGALQEQLLRDAGLSGPEYSVLVPLSHTPDGVLRARELGTELGWDRSRLSHLVGRMEKRGLVAREECSEDARGSMVRLTDAGTAAVEDAAPEHSEAIRRYFFNPLSSAELETLAVVFDRLLENLARDKA
jgi:DNA-binding MarR family transcriptional regulator